MMTSWGRDMNDQDYEKPDFWAQKAAKEGYPARSVYKLKELDEKFGLLGRSGSGPSRSILDLGAAPGSWTQFVLEKIAQEGGHVTAVDLKPLTKIYNTDKLTVLLGDMTCDEVFQQVENLGPYDTILSDAAPSTTGNRLVDTARSESLLEFALIYADKVLRAQGNFVVKLFQGSDLGGVLKIMRTLFSTARTFKPKACRSNSIETYLVGLGKR
jgi:23S rRNA (uridine2552-2'-O)-methyltransferase